MIVPTMNNREKAYEAFRVTQYLAQCMDNHLSDVVRKFKNNTRFPYFQRFIVQDDKNNNWVCLFYMLNKQHKKEKKILTIAYTIYNVPPKHKEDDNSSGKGCILFDPYSMKNFIEHKIDRMVSVCDITPHTFNRYTERYLKPLNKDNIKFEYKVESMLARWGWFDICADLYGDINTQNHKEDDKLPYDVMMKGGGILKGQLTHDLLIRFFTYIGKDMMYDNQLLRQEEMRAEYLKLFHKRIKIS